MTKRWGATPDDWFNFGTLYGLGADLLPVVSNLEAVVSPRSSLKHLGKTPSVYNAQGEVAGIADWTKKTATQRELAKWEVESDYGICVIARLLKAIDVDVTDAHLSWHIRQAIRAFTGRVIGEDLPERFRANSTKFLVAFKLPCKTLKRVIKTEHGIIEFLGDRQQFIAAGTHPSGEKYEWNMEYDQHFPELTLEQFDELWSLLETEFGIEPSRVENERKDVKAEYVEDALYQKLSDKGMVLSEESNGSLGIVCPFGDEHTTESGNSGTVYWPAHTGGYAHSSIKCLHAHCAHRQTHDFAEALGITAVDDFDVLAEDDIVPPKPVVTNARRWPSSMAEDFIEKKTLTYWLVKNLIPGGSTGLACGQGGVGKTFIMLDLMAAVARGVPWNGLKTHKAQVVYVCAESVGGFRNRMKAYMQHHGLDKLDIAIVEGAPKFGDKQTVLDFIAMIKELYPGCKWVVVDTVAMCMDGDENSGVDVDKFLKGLEVVSKALGVAVTCVHHLGKDASRGARGHSKLRNDTAYQLTLTKHQDEGQEARYNLFVERQKEVDAGSSYNYRLRVVKVGLDMDGEDVTSCVVEFLDDAEFQTVEEPAKVLGKLNQRIIDVTKEFYIGNVRWPSISEVTTLVREGNDRRKNVVVDAIEHLVEKGGLDERDGRLVVPGRPPNTVDLSE